MILRIEDTDQSRYVKGAEDYLLEALNWCGIKLDESSVDGGNYGPYKQSERKAIYYPYAKQLINDGFSSSPKFKCFVAEINQEIVGMALGYPRYSTWKGPTIHLEDLIVTKSKRGLGIGFKLFSKFIHYAHELNVKRIEWVVLDWNKSAIDFYKKNGAHVLDDWRVAQMDFNAIKKFVNNEDF